MNIRPATVEETPAIIHLLKQSLGESTIPKSQEFWNWKHVHNPFGKSYILIAEENNTVIGLRAFMQWQWQWNGKVYKAIRAVDTATHPMHQGKGIFKKLTLQQVEVCKQDGEHFIFNTPNSKSKPGYLKMGWEEQGRMPIKFKFMPAFSFAYSKFFENNKKEMNGDDVTPSQEWSDRVFDLLNKCVLKKDQLTTVISPKYILWRYAKNPLFKYNYFTDFENFLLISRIKNHSYTKELRLADFILLNAEVDEKYLNDYIKKAVFVFCKMHNATVISLSAQQYKMYKPYFKWMGVLPIQPLGPVITLKDLNVSSEFNDLLDYKNWGYSLGDMELF